MDTSIHFSEVLGLLGVLTGAGLCLWVVAHQLYLRHAERRLRLMMQRLYR